MTSSRIPPHKPSMVDALNDLGSSPWANAQAFIEWAEGYDPAAVDDRGDTVLMQLASDGRADLVEAAWPWCDPAAVNHEGMSAWLYAAKNSAVDVIGRLAPLLDTEARNHQDHNGWSALHHASEHGKLDVLAALLGHGVGVDHLTTGDPLDGTALMFIAEEYKPSAHLAVQALLDAGANPALVDSDGNSALMWASRRGTVATLQCLIAAGEDPNHRNHDGETLLMGAMSSPDHVAGKLDLLLPMVDPNAQALDGHTALDEALKWDLFIEAGRLAAVMRPDLVQSILRPYMGLAEVAPWFQAAQAREQAELRQALARSEGTVSPARARL